MFVVTAIAAAVIILVGGVSIGQQHPEGTVGDALFSSVTPK